MFLGNVIGFNEKSDLQVRCYKPTKVGRWLGQKVKWMLHVSKCVAGQYRVIGGKELAEGDEVEITTDGLRIAMPDGEHFYIRSWEA